MVKPDKEKTEYHMKNLDAKMWADFNTAVIINQTTMKDVILKAVKRYVNENRGRIDGIKRN